MVRPTSDVLTARSGRLAPCFTIVSLYIHQQYNQKSCSVLSSTKYSVFSYSVFKCAFFEIRRGRKSGSSPTQLVLAQWRWQQRVQA
jgi:hypothetical protein